MNKEKQFYEAPTVQTFAIRTEGAILTASTDAVTIQDWQDGGLTIDF